MEEGGTHGGGGAMEGVFQLWEKNQLSTFRVGDVH